MPMSSMRPLSAESYRLAGSLLFPFRVKVFIVSNTGYWSVGICNFIGYPSIFISEKLKFFSIGSNYFPQGSSGPLGSASAADRLLDECVCPLDIPYINVDPRLFGATRGDNNRAVNPHVP